MRVYLTSELKSKMDVLCSEYNCEIGGYLCGEIKRGEIFLSDILIPSQEVSTGHIQISPQGQVGLLRRYGDKCKKIIGHFHSHHSMGVFWSGVDFENMENIMEYKKLFVFIVGSMGSYKVRVCIREPIYYNFEDVDLYVRTVMIDLLRKRVKKIFEQIGRNINDGDDREELKNGESGEIEEEQ